MKTINKLDIIIFSYNRAMQLNTLLSSIYQHLKFEYDIYVLYNYSGDFEKGYQKLISAFDFHNIHFIKEEKSECKPTFKELTSIYNLKKYLKYHYIRSPKTDFRKKLINILQYSSNNFLMFLTDDSVFIKDSYIATDVFSEIQKKPSDVSFSYRLGKNINQPSYYEETSHSIIRWNYLDKRNKRDWCYNFSVDGHIYDKNYILIVASKVLFSNPSSFESFMEAFIYNKKKLSIGFAETEPSIVSYPINMVQAIEKNESLDVSLTLLEEMFLKGYRLEYPLPNIITTFQHYPDFIYFIKEDERIKRKISC